MANVLTKFGTSSNVDTYEHVCDTYADMTNIPKNQINLGSTCLVLKGKSGNVEIYISDTNRNWILLSDFNSGSGSGSGSGGNSGSSSEPSDLERVTEAELDEMLNGGNSGEENPTDAERLTENELEAMLNG